MKLNTKEIEAIVKLPSNKRYEYFLKKITDWENVWGLYNDGWALMSDNSGESYFPLWPFKEYADLYAVDEWAFYKPKQMNLKTFKEGLLMDLKIDKVRLSIFPTKLSENMTVEIDDFLKDMNSEESKYL